MPTYQYACTACDERLEVVQKFSDEPLSVCTTCGGKLRKLFSAVGIVFKGSGFYRTDSRNGSSGAGGPKEQKGPDSGGSADSGSPASESSTTASSSGGASSQSDSSPASGKAAGSKASPGKPSAGTKVA